MIKILLINSTLERSGITNVFYNLCKYLDPEIFEIHIVTLSPEKINSRWKDFEALNTNMHPLNLTRKEGFFKLRAKLKTIVEDINPAIIQTMSYRGSYYAYRYLKKYKRVVTIQGNIYDNYSDEFGKLLGGYFAYNELRAFKNATAGVLCSDSLKQFYTRDNNVSVIRNGADPECFYIADETEKEKLKVLLKFPLEKNIFVSVGSLIKRKDPLTIIKAFLTSERINDSILMMLGDGPLMAQCMTVAGSAPAVIFKGNVINVPDYYKTADAFISSSHSEGLPNTVLEAGLSGLYCLLSDIPQHREIFEKQSKQASFFNKCNMDELKVLFNNFKINSHAQTINLDAKLMADQYSKLYSSLLFNN